LNTGVEENVTDWRAEAREVKEPVDGVVWPTGVESTVLPVIAAPEIVPPLIAAPVIVPPVIVAPLKVGLT
jgi:hypothetical protein